MYLILSLYLFLSFFLCLSVCLSVCLVLSLPPSHSLSLSHHSRQIFSSEHSLDGGTGMYSLMVALQTEDDQILELN